MKIAIQASTGMPSGVFEEKFRKSCGRFAASTFSPFVSSKSMPR